MLLISTKERSETKFNLDIDKFYNPEITKVEVTVEDFPDELQAQNMKYRHHYDEIMKHFGEGQLEDTGAMEKDLQLHDVNINAYYTDGYALWLDFRDHNKFRISSRRIENTLEGIQLQIRKSWTSR